MKTSSSRSPMFRVTMFLACCVSGAGVGSAQQAQYAQPPQYDSANYQTQKPSVTERIRSTGQNVGSFIRRKFYGESSPASYGQQPVYQRPSGSQPVSYQAQSYSLDAPAQPVGGTNGTGFQSPAPGSLPKYVTPPTTTPSVVSKSGSKTVAAAPKTKSSPPPSTTAAAKTTTKKRYSPAKPSTFSKPKLKPAPEPRRVQDEPPAAPPPPTEPQVNTEPTTEARLNNEIYPLPGSPESAPSTTAGISPTIGGTEVDLTPKTPAPEQTVTSSPPSTTTGTTTETGSKSSGSFLVGKKTSKAGRVVSPYAPYNELDITGLPSGSLALDPTTQKVFEVP